MLFDGFWNNIYFGTIMMFVGPIYLWRLLNRKAPGVAGAAKAAAGRKLLSVISGFLK